jgi:cysteine synthase A
MHNIECALIGIEPSESPLITMGRAAPHGIQGIGANFIPKILDLKLIDEVIDVTTDDSIEMAKKIYELEGIYVGYSSGAALLGAISHIKERELTEDVVVIFPDKGDRYQWQN